VFSAPMLRRTSATFRNSTAISTGIVISDFAFSLRAARGD
jgi:hypothetical protein